MATYDELIKQQNDKLTSRPTILSERDRLANEMGVNARQNQLNSIRQNIVSTQRLLDQTPQNVQSRARQLGGPVTNAALSRLTQVRREPLVGQLGKFSQDQGVQEQGLNDVNNQIGQQVALISQQRGQEDSLLQNQIDKAFQQQQAEQAFAQQQALARLQAGLQASAQAKMLKMQQDSDAVKQKALAALMGTGAATGGLTLGASTANPNAAIALQKQKNANDLLMNGSLGGEVVKALGGLGGFAGGRNLTPAQMAATNGISAAIFGTDRLGTATSQRQETDLAGEQRINKFLQSNPQYRGQVTNVGQLAQLMRQFPGQFNSF